MGWVVKKFGFFILIGSSVAGFWMSALHPIAFYLIIAVTLALALLLERMFPYDAAWNRDQFDTNCK